MRFSAKAVLPMIALSISMASPSAAATFSVLGTEYDLTTITGTFNGNQDLLESQVWWNGGTLASTFAGITREALAGLPNSSPTLGNNIYGPFFADKFFVSDPENRVQATAVSITGQINGITFDRTKTVTFAIVAPAPPLSTVPLPAGGLLLLSALAGAVGLKRRKKRRA